MYKKLISENLKYYNGQIEDIFSVHALSLKTHQTANM